MIEQKYIVRFWTKVNKKSDDECWNWIAGKFNNGYGAMGYEGKTIKAHRLSFMIHFGPIPDGAFICHSCDNPSCVNPNHLWAGTCLDNLIDMRQKGRAPVGIKNGQYTKPESYRKDRHGWTTHPESKPKGERNGRAKITQEQASEIRQRYHCEQITMKQLAQEYGIGRSSIFRIIHNQSWVDD